ncbi:uncharacterized protein LOC120176565 [Hibiscus syriacus]|uniref:uncharacterized protein LOC120176565 n=1 Tax=Hibiscus syriacus TaxID=106335 RepID=UPI0019224F4F|nr:uncharacterized protein LOC120176565 [Hibiscus syriacus]
MAIKVDLEKEFDRLRWGFIHDTLLTFGFLPNLIRIIMHCITTSSFQLQWNDSLTASFHPERGIRQGDPLSPYLFVLAIERLGHCISDRVNKQIWEAFRFSKDGYHLSHLFFADDLILYAKSDIFDADTINSALANFRHYSGHRVNKRKTTIYFSPNTSTQLKEVIRDRLGFKQVTELGKYLGVPVHHGRSRRADYAFIIEKMRGLLERWGVCKEIEKLVRCFIWGSSGAHSSCSLINQETICQPLNRGGLGIRRIHEQNQALLMKACFNLIANPSAYLIQLFRQKYKVTKLFSLLISRKICSLLWRFLSNLWPSFRNTIAWSIGNGVFIQVWDDIWIPSLDTLRNHIQPPNQVLPQRSLAGLVRQDGKWNSDLLGSLLNPNAFNHVPGVMPPPNDGSIHRCIWRWELNTCSRFHPLMIPLLPLYGMRPLMHGI